MRDYFRTSVGKYLMKFSSVIVRSFGSYVTRAINLVFLGKCSTGLLKDMCPPIWYNEHARERSSNSNRLGLRQFQWRPVLLSSCIETMFVMKPWARITFLCVICFSPRNISTLTFQLPQASIGIGELPALTDSQNSILFKIKKSYIDISLQIWTSDPLSRI